MLLDNNQRNELIQLSQSRTAPFREVQRAAILLHYARGKTITAMKNEVGVSRPTIYKCIDKALAAGIETGLKDKYHKPRDAVITPEAKAWVVNLACTKPKDHGYAAETWTLSKLAKHTREYAPAASHEWLKRASKATIHRIRKSQPLQPHKGRYDLEKRDEQCEKKMRAGRSVYKEVNEQNQSPGKHQGKKIVTVSLDEKPGMQAISKVAPDLPPQPGKYPGIGRDDEYKRFGTLS